ncbi:putative cysteine protease [Listeria floridensis FSL S10-1187]|uniref:Cysteine protease n=1 Tax=Listeria floridensis FSL S10-1187 TaxID=1265817 RepID=A0ABN0RIC3_9LIST|nr:sortase [Listeria floridensis]EUJ33698.1 putative cysteine protease [Listeria floridensis FSL S10-1187]
MEKRTVTHGKKAKKNRKKGIGLIILFGLFFIFVGFGATLFAQNRLAQADLKTIKQETVIPTKLSATTTKADYQKSDLVEQPTIRELSEFRKSDAYQKTLNKAIGTIEITEIGLKLPILGGTNAANLNVGATTYRQDQEVGKGNFVLLGHNMGESGVLFSDLYQLKKVI